MRLAASGINRARRGRGAARGRLRPFVAVAGLLAVVMSVLTGPPASAQVSSPSTTAPPAVTTTTSTPSGTTSTTPTTAPTGTTTTTTAAIIPLPNVPGPPPAPLVSPATDPKKLAQAALLEKQIAAQTVVIDKLANRFNQQQLLADAAAKLASTAQAKLEIARADEAQARVDSAVALAALRTSGINAYLGTKLSPVEVHSPFGPAYEAGLARAYSGTVVGSISERVQALRLVHDRLVAAGRTIESETRKAQDGQAAADAAFGKANADSQAAQVEQNRLTTTLAQVRGDLTTLVDAQRASLAWQSYTQLNGGRLLDFVPGRVPAGVLAQTPTVMALGLAQLGKPYLWGGTGPDQFDCSGLMQWSWFLGGGVKIPRVAADQQAWATPIPISQILPGDLVFFGAPAHHVGMYLGGGLMLDAPHTGAWVEVVPIWWTELSGFGRVHP
jgi:cell wall-associated NlpC family hydrolase